MSKYRFSKRSLDNLKGIHPKLVKVMKEAVKESPVDFTIVQGVRTEAEQRELYSWGRTKKNPNTGKMTIVTYKNGTTNKSNHQKKADGYGYAVDLYPFFLGKVQVNHKDTINRLKNIADHILEVSKKQGVQIKWGGNFKKPYDPPHFELIK